MASYNRDDRFAFRRSVAGDYDEEYDDEEENEEEFDEYQHMPYPPQQYMPVYKPKPRVPDMPKEAEMEKPFILYLDSLNTVNSVNMQCLR